MGVPIPSIPDSKPDMVLMLGDNPFPVHRGVISSWSARLAQHIDECLKEQQHGGSMEDPLQVASIPAWLCRFRS